MVIEKMQVPTNAGSQGGRADNITAYFYCHGNEEPRRDPKMIMASIVKQLTAPLMLCVPEQVVKAYDQRVKDGFASGCLELRECRGLAVSLLGVYSKVTIILDALDELLPDDQEQLLDALEIICRSSPEVKIFISSRFVVGIRRGLANLSSPSHHVGITGNRHDIERFIHREVTEGIERKKLVYGKLGLNDDLTNEIIQTLLTKSDGM